MRHGEGGQLGRHVGAEPLARRAAQPGQPGGQFGHLAGERRFLLGEGADLVVVGVEVGDPDGGAARPVEHGGYLVGFFGRVLPARGREVEVRGDAAGAVDADQPVQRRAALLDDGEPGRVGVDRLDVGGQLGGHFGDEVRGVGEPAGHAVDLGVMTAHLLQRPPRLAEQRDRVGAVHGRGRVAEQRLVRHRRAGVQRVGVGQPLLLGAQRGLLAGLRLELLDLGRGRAERSASAARDRASEVSVMSSSCTVRCRWNVRW